MTPVAGPNSPGEEEFPQLYVVLVTVPDEESGRALAQEVVGARLAACGNLIPGLTSVYRWEGQLRRDSESLVIFKTTASRVSALREHVVKSHPYEVPEVLAVAVVEGHVPYLEWVKGEVEETGNS